MFSTAEEAIAYTREEGVKFIDVRFCDLPGVMQHFSIPVAAFKDDKKPGCGAVTHTRAVCGAGGVTQRILHPI